MPNQSRTALTVVRRRDLEKLLKLSRSTIYDKLNPDSPRYDPSFPKPFRLGNGSAVGWLESEVQEWLEMLVSKSRKVML